MPWMQSLQTFYLFYIYLFIWLQQVLLVTSQQANMWDLAPWPGIKPGPRAWGAQSLSPWTSRDVPANFS